MVIKKYMVNNMNEALTRIRYELGREAIIVSQRKVRKPGIKGFFTEKQLEVTAAVENDSKDYIKKTNSEVQNSIQDIKRFIKEPTINTKEVNSVQEEIVDSKINEEIKSIKEVLNRVLENTTKEDKDIDILEELMRDKDIDLEFYEELKSKVDISNCEESIREIIKSELKVTNEKMEGNVVFVGPTGVGKTTTIAKLAGKYALMEKKKVGLITVDTYRIGAVEQLKTYAEIMNIPFKVAISTREMEEAIKFMDDCDVVFIDTTGRSSKNTMQISELRVLIEKAKPTSINLVISSTTKNKDIKIITEGYKELKYDNVIITKIDETATYGSIYNISKRCMKPLRYLTTGQNVPDDLMVPTNEAVVNLVLGDENIC